MSWPMGGAVGVWQPEYRAVQQWGNEEVNLHVIEDTRYAVVTRAWQQRSGFNYHFVVDDSVVEVRVELLTRDVAMAETTRTFHALFAGDGRHLEDIDAVIVLFMTEGERHILDFPGMAES